MERAFSSFKLVISYPQLRLFKLNIKKGKKLIIYRSYYIKLFNFEILTSLDSFEVVMEMQVN